MERMASPVCVFLDFDDIHAAAALCSELSCRVLELIVKKREELARERTQDGLEEE